MITPKIKRSTHRMMRT